MRISREIVQLLLLLTAFSGSASPKIDRISPQGLVPGTNTVLTFKGSDLEKVSEVWTSFGGESKRQTNATDEVAFEVSCPSDVCGIGALQVIGPNGISDYQLIFIDLL